MKDRMEDCEECGGSGLQRIIGAKIPCPYCGGSGRLRAEGISWIREDLFEDEGFLAEVRSGHGKAAQVPVPSEVPSQVTFSVVDGPRPSYTYTYEIQWEGLVITYQGVPIEEHDLIPDYMIARLDQAIMVTAREDV